MKCRKVGWLIDSLRPGKQFFSHVGTEPPLPGYYQYFWGVNVPCSRTQHGLTRVGLEPPTFGSGVRGINHQATALPKCGKGCPCEVTYDQISLTTHTKIHPSCPLGSFGLVIV